MQSVLFTSSVQMTKITYFYCISLIFWPCNARR